MGAPRGTLPSLWACAPGLALIPFVVLVVGLLKLNWKPCAALRDRRADRGAGRAAGGRRLSIRGAVSLRGGWRHRDRHHASTAIARVLIGAMSLTGVAFSLTQQLLAISGGSLPLLLLITAIASFILRPAAADGRRLYLATLAAPARCRRHLAMQAHLFVLFRHRALVAPPVRWRLSPLRRSRIDQWKPAGRRRG
jgi:TRAP-type uncharacterized transport system fused permease subunit